LIKRWDFKENRDKNFNSKRNKKNKKYNKRKGQQAKRNKNAQNNQNSESVWHKDIAHTILTTKQAESQGKIGNQRKVQYQSPQQNSKNVK
jgi:hypothetical protein